MKFPLFIFIFLASYISLYPQGEEIVSALSDRGFENVAGLEHNKDLYLTYENNLFRFEAKALAFILIEISKFNVNPYERIHFLIRSQDIPMVLVSFSTTDLENFSTGLIDRQLLISKLNFSIEVDDVDDLFRNFKTFNSSFFKVDVPFGLSLDYSLGDFRDGFQSRTYLNTRVLSTLGRGSAFEFNFLNIVQNDIPGWAISSPVTLKITQSARFGSNTFLSASIGYLPQGKFGLYTRFRNYLDRERFYIEMIYGVNRGGYLDQFWEIQSNRNSDALWQAVFNYRWNKYDTDINLRYGTFASSDLGYKFQIQRQFNEVYFTLFYSRTDIMSLGSFNSEEPAIVGFSLVVPFGQSKYAKPKKIRARTEDSFYLLYRYSGLSLSGIDIMFGNDLLTDIEEFYPEILRKGLIKHFKPQNSFD